MINKLLNGKDTVRWRNAQETRGKTGSIDTGRVGGGGAAPVY